MQVVNCTKRHVTLATPEGARHTYAPSGILPYVPSRQMARREVEGLPVPVQDPPQDGALRDMPAPQPGLIYLVSRKVLRYCEGRRDVFSPGFSPKDEPILHGGQPVAARVLHAAPPAPATVAAEG